MRSEGRPGWGTLALAEAKIQVKLIFRNVVSAFFTLVMPLVFLVVFNLFIGGVPLSDGSPASMYYTPAIAVFALVTATFTNLAIGTAIARDNGVLKRVYGSPMPLTAHIAGRVLASTLVGLASVALMLVIGMAAYGVSVPWGLMPAFALILLVGAASFSALGVAVAMLSPSARAAPALANAIVLPMLLISGIFFPLTDAPSWLAALGRALPLAPFVEAAVAHFVPSAVAGPLAPRVVVIAVWGAVGVVVAVRLFRWEPARNAGGRRRLSPMS